MFIKQFSSFISLWVGLVLLACCLAGCGYRWGQGGIVTDYRTISIPYIEGDFDGDFTATLIQQMSESGRLAYRAEGGALILQVSVFDEHDKDIGFRYDRTKHCKIRSRIIPDETRLSMSVDVVVVEAISGCEVMGPVRLTADVDFDHEYYSGQGRANVFSLGQLTDYDDARDAAYVPLYRRLSQKIVDYVNDNW